MSALCRCAILAALAGAIVAGPKRAVSARKMRAIRRAADAWMVM